MDSPTLVIILAAVLGILLTVSGSLGVWLALRTGQNTQTLKNFRDSAASWRDKAEATDSELASVRAELADTKAELADLQLRHTALKDVVTGREALEALGLQVDKVKDEIIFEIRLNRGALDTLIGTHNNDGKQ